MTFPQILEVAIGLVLTYYIMGSVVSAVTQYALDTLRIKRKIFEEYMGLIFGKRDVKRILALPQVKSLGTKVTVNILVDSFWDIFGFTAYERSPSATEEMLIRLVNMIPEDSAGKQAMVTWINCAITNTNDLRVRITDYFAGLKEEIEANYSSKSRKYMVIISLAITIITGVDSLQLAKELWTNSELRTLAMQSANIAASGSSESATASSPADITTIPIKIGWVANDFPSNPSFGIWLSYLLYKIAGLGVTVACVSQGSAFWSGLLKKLG